jgi:hypothetical protein
MLLTDVCNRPSIRAPENRPTPEPAACAAATASAMRRSVSPKPSGRGVGPPCGNPAPGRAALDGASPASDRAPASLHSFIEEETSPARERRFPAAAFSAAHRAGDPASDAPCRAPRSPFSRRRPSARTASTALASTRAASPIRGAFHRQVLPYPLARREPATDPRLCRRGPASDALSLPVMLSHGGARPSTVVTGCSPVVARTARRLPTSAIETNCEHNCPIDRAPHTVLKSPPAQLSLRVAEPPFGAQPAEMSRIRDRRG